MSTCTDCQHWDRTQPGRPGHRCEMLESSGEVFADAWDKEGIFTSPGFGCNLFELAAPPSNASHSQPKED